MTAFIDATNDSSLDLSAREAAKWMSSILSSTNLHRDDDHASESSESNIISSVTGNNYDDTNSTNAVLNTMSTEELLSENEALKQDLIDIKLKLAHCQSQHDYSRLRIVKLEMDLKKANSDNQSMRRKLGIQDDDDDDEKRGRRNNRNKGRLTKSLSEKRSTAVTRRQNRSWFGGDGLSMSWSFRRGDKPFEGEGISSLFTEIVEEQPKNEPPQLSCSSAGKHNFMPWESKADRQDNAEASCDGSQKVNSEDYYGLTVRYDPSAIQSTLEYNGIIDGRIEDDNESSQSGDSPTFEPERDYEISSRSGDTSTSQVSFQPAKPHLQKKLSFKRVAVSPPPQHAHLQEMSRNYHHPELPKAPSLRGRSGGTARDAYLALC